MYIAHQHLINKMFSIAHTEATVKMLSERNKTMGNFIQICECHGHTQLQAIDMLNR